MYRPWGSHSQLLPMVSSLYSLYVCSVIVAFICIKKLYLPKGKKSSLLENIPACVHDYISKSYLKCTHVRFGKKTHFSFSKFPNVSLSLNITKFSWLSASEF